MKNFLLLLLVLCLIFISLVYWSVSIGPDELQVSKVIGREEQDSVVVVPTNRYESNKIKRFMQGQNYRRAWATPIKAPLFYLDSMTIVEEGGGKQTNSLRLKSPSGILYSLRSVNKDPEPLVPEIAKTLGVENIIVDGISAQHPFGALLAAELSEAAGILHTHPKVVYVPQQKALNTYSIEYGNELYLLEYETEGVVDWTQIQNATRIADTDDLQQLKKKYPDRVKIDQRAFVRARLFDLLIGDWDRHAKQWGWVIQKKNNQFNAIPLAGDRDNAFFRIDGLIPTMLTNELIQPMVRPFETDIDYVPGFVYPVDQYFLKDTPLEIFLEQAHFLQNTLTDKIIAESLNAWPQEFRQLNGSEILTKIKKRRADLVTYARAFHEAIQDKEYIEKPLKGSEDLSLPKELQRCFDCLE